MSNLVSDSIIEMLKFGFSKEYRSKIESARGILEMVESAFSYYTSQTASRHVPVFYLPKTELSLGKVLSKYIIIRFGLLSEKYRKKLKWAQSHPGVVPAAWTKEYKDSQKEIDFTNKNGLEETKKVGSLKREFDSIASQLMSSEQGEVLFSDHSVNILVCDSVLADSFFLAKYYEDTNFRCSHFSLQYSMCVLSEQNKDFKYLKNSVWAASRRGEISVDKPVTGNVFVFFSNSERYRSFNKSGVLSTLSQKGYLIRNLFVFYLTDKTFSLKKLVEEKSRFANIYQGQDNSGEDFICYPVDEAAEMTIGLHLSNNRYLIECGDDYDIYFPAVSEMIDGFDRRQRVLCNIIALCATKKAENAFYTYLHSLDTDFEPDESIAIFDYMRTLWRQSIIPKIESFAASSKRIAVVVEASTPKEIRDEIQSVFPDIELVFYRPSELIPSKGRILIPEETIIVMRFLHCKSYPSSIPNSYDPYVVNPGQRLLEIIPEVLFKGLIDVSKSNRIRLTNKVLDSAYRRNVLNWKPSGYLHRSDINRFDIFGDEESDDENGNSGPGRVVRLEMKDGSVSYPIETEPVIIKKQTGQLDTGILREMVDDSSVVGIQFFSELERILEGLLNDRCTKGIIADNNLREELKRQFPNCDFSSGEVWKLALKARIDTQGFDQVVRDLSLLLDEKNVASRIKDWSNLESRTMLPRKRKTRRILFEYLGIHENHSYLNSLYSRYLRTIHDARYYNGLIDDLIRMVVGHQITKDYYLSQKKSFPEVLELFGVNSYEDLDAMCEIVNEHIVIRNIKSITTND